MKTLVKRSNPRFNNLSSVFDDLLFNNELGTANRTFQPSVNIKEDDTSFSMAFSLPGYQKEDLSIRVENDLLVISSEKQNEEVVEGENYSRREFSFSSFSRSFTLPEIVDVEKINATSKDGIITIHLPKNIALLEKRVKSIEIK